MAQKRYISLLKSSFLIKGRVANFIVLVIILSFIFCVGCTNRTECKFDYVNAQQITYKAKGCLVDSLENGHWIIYDSTGQIIEQGQFDHGVRIGIWQYPTQVALARGVEWEKYSNDSIGFLTNVPKILQSVEEGGYYVKWKTSDSSKSLQLVIAIHDLSGNSIDMDSFYLQSVKEIEAKGFRVSHKLEKLYASGRTYYFNFYEVRNNNMNFQMLNCYGAIDGHLIDINVRFDISDAAFARNLFASILSNIFIDSKRFINPFAEINR
jgi:hypothetical protein